LLVVVLFAGVVVAADLALQGKLGKPPYERVAAGTDGAVRISLAGLEPQQVRFFHFLNASNQEVWFFVGRDASGQLQVAFDASDVCAKGKRGFRHEGPWLVCNKCDKSFRLAETNAGGGGCRPVPLKFAVASGEVVIAQADVLTGWRLFR
jgi:uncharacterized membrane protein